MRTGRYARGPVECHEAADVVVEQVEDREGLDAALRHGVQAAIAAPEHDEAWRAELSAAVARGEFKFPRTVLPAVTHEDLRHWLDRLLLHQPVQAELARELRDDVLSLVRLQGVLARSAVFMVRLSTDAPSRRCGFHVDTVAPRAPTIGLLRVYGGAGTDYVEPSNVLGSDDFYRDLSARERLARELERAAVAGDEAAWEEASRAIDQLDCRPRFLRDPPQVKVAAAGTIVAFRHLDVRRHWSSHPMGLAWVHRSPMEGEPRVVVSVTAREPGALRAAR